MQKIYSLQYLRAFAAIWILLTHVLQQCEVRLNGVFWAGQWGVDIFFLLSGFIIYLTTRVRGWISVSNESSESILLIFSSLHYTCYTTQRLH